MKMNITEHVVKNDWTGDFILKVMTEYEKECRKTDSKADFFKIFSLNSTQPGGILSDIKLIINGVECPVEPFIDTIAHEYDYQLNEAAKKLLQEKFSEIDNFLYDLKGSIMAKFPEMKIGDED